MRLGRLAQVILTATLLAISVPASKGIVGGPVYAQDAGVGGGLRGLLRQLQDLDQQGALAGGGGLGGVGSGSGSSSTSGDVPFGLDRPAVSQAQRLKDLEAVRQIRAKNQLLIEAYCRTSVTATADDAAFLQQLISRLERDYCVRAKEPLAQFGYEIFEKNQPAETSEAGAVQDDYILGIGDEIVISLFGQQQQTFRVRVDREGRAIIGNLGPVSASGRTLGDVRREIESRVDQGMIGTKVYVSLGKIKTIFVTVAGEVEFPGVKRLTGLSTVLDALVVSGGVRKTGSLRRIEIHRANDIFWLDIYELLNGGGLGHNLVLTDGDRVVVPQLGPTVAVAGRVRRPGIFELAEGRDAIQVKDLIALSGGPLRPEGNIVSLVSFDSSGSEYVTEGVNPNSPVSNGALVRVGYGRDTQTKAVELVGHVTVPQRRALESAGTLGGLLGDVTLLKTAPYLLFGVLETTDPATHARRLFPVNLDSVLQRQQDFALRDGDKLIVLSSDDVAYLASDDVQRVLQFGRKIEEVGAEKRPGGSDEADGRQLTASTHTVPSPLSRVFSELGSLQTVPAEGERTQEQKGQPTQSERRAPAFACSGLQTLASIVTSTRSERFAYASTLSDENLQFVNERPCPQVYDETPLLLPFVLEHVVAITGEVRIPGVYPIVNGTPLSKLASVAGGLTREADLGNVEVSRFSDGHAPAVGSGVRETLNVRDEGFSGVVVNPGDVVRFNRMFTDRDSGPVLLSGEFVHPGLYDIRRGERLSEVIHRAGGLTSQAFPYGAVFTRERVKRAQQEGFERALRELNATATFAAAKKGIDPTAVVALQEVTRQLGSVEAVGRVVIESDPTVLQVRPELDTVLEPGDKVFMPKRPNSVLVIGDVLNPGALQFIAGEKADNYIRQAGGLQQSADEDRVFVVYPNGVAQPVSVSVWNYNPFHIPPGSTIVVPKNPAPLDIFTFSKDLATLVSQFAITAASLAVIGNN